MDKANIHHEKMKRNAKTKLRKIISMERNSRGPFFDCANGCLLQKTMSSKQSFNKFNKVKL